MGSLSAQCLRSSGTSDGSRASSSSQMRRRAPARSSRTAQWPSETPSRGGSLVRRASDRLREDPRALSPAETASGFVVDFLLALVLPQAHVIGTVAQPPRRAAGDSSRRSSRRSAIRGRRSGLGAARRAPWLRGRPPVTLRSSLPRCSRRCSGRLPHLTRGGGRSRATPACLSLRGSDPLLTLRCRGPVLAWAGRRFNFKLASAQCHGGQIPLSYSNIMACLALPPATLLV